ncbi:MAG: hypothetical protein LBH90_03970, partial [Tannerella sp.]|nr:hypothetical protein [Tannerella sp.]
SRSSSNLLSRDTPKRFKSIAGTKLIIQFKRDKHQRFLFYPHIFQFSSPNQLWQPYEASLLIARLP